MFDRVGACSEQGSWSVQPGGVGEAKSQSLARAGAEAARLQSFEGDRTARA